MKKTEKIEVRLSHEEKSALTSLAEQEGRSVSDLVRGLIERYMSINTTRLPRKTPWLLLSAIAIGGFFAGHLATYLIGKSHANSHSDVYDLSVQFDGNGVSIPILLRAGESVESTIPSSSGDIRITAAVKSNPESLSSVELYLCREMEDRCVAVATPNLKFNPNKESSIIFNSEGEQKVYIRLAPTTIPAHN